jgi:hypothetical protein
MMFLAHARQNRLLGTIVEFAQLLFRPMRNAPPTLDRHLVAIVIFAALAGWTMRTAETRLLDILVATRMLARFALGAMRNAQTALHNTVLAIAHSALATNAFARAASCQGVTGTFVLTHDIDWFGRGGFGRFRKGRRIAARWILHGILQEKQITFAFQSLKKRD